MNAKTLLFSATAFIIGFALARVWPTASSPKETPATNVQIDKGDTAPVVPSNKQSERGHTVDFRDADSKGDTNGAKGGLRHLATLRDRHVRAHFLTRRDEIDDSFAEMLGVGPGKIATLNTALKKARDRLNNLSAKAASVSVSEEGVIVVRVPPFEGGESVYDDLMEAVQSELGDRGAEFNKLFGDEFADAFQNFGALQRTLTIARSFPGYEDWKDGGLWMKDERRTASGRVEVLPLRFYPDRMQYLFTHLKWIEPMLGERLKAEVRNP